jgi:predicted Rossmann fold flavoprotein
LPAPGKKLLATGGGHCNITNTASHEDFYAAFGRQGRFIAPALENFDNKALVKFFDKLAVPMSVDDGFHVFPSSGKAANILNALLIESRNYAVEIFLSSKVDKIKISDGAISGISAGELSLDVKKIILASGGMSYPQLGATGDAYKFAKFAGHSIVEPVPALVELYCTEKWPAKLAGVSLQDVEISVPKSKILPQRGGFLFTHHGISGPAALNISGEISALLSKKNPSAITVNFTPFKSPASWASEFAKWRTESGNSMLSCLLSDFMPKSLAQTLCELASANFAKSSQINSQAQKRLIELICGAVLNVNGNAGFTKAMLTKGGVSLKEINPHNLESKIIRGLFFAGELLDIQGPCGGFNLQWAFSSGKLAAEAE